MLARRRLLAAVCAAVAVVAALRAVSPPPPRLVVVPAAAHDLAAGAVLGPDDVVALRLPADAVPGGALGDPVGATLAAPVRSGEPLTDVRLVGQPGSRPPPGLVATPVRLPDAAAAALLRPGDRIDLLATDARRGRTWQVASDALVLQTPAADETTAGPLGGRVVLLGVPVSSVEKVQGAAVALYLGYTYSD